MNIIKLSNNIKQIFNILNMNIFYSNEINYVDVGKTNDVVTYLMNNKLDRIVKNDLDPWINLRTEMKIGKFLSKHFLLEDKEIEYFVNKYKSYYDFFINNSLFEIVSGKDIALWYDSKKYKPGGGSLNSSCMRQAGPERFKLYTDNPDKIKLLILKEGDQLIGRSIMWIDDNNKVYIDRPYTRYEQDSYLYIAYADKMGYYNYFNRKSCCDFRLTIKKTLNSNNIPYLDSMDIKNKVITLKNF